MKRITKLTLVLLMIVSSNITKAQEKNMKTAEENYTNWYPGYSSTMEATDPELSSIFKNFAFGETQEYGNLDIKKRIILTMASTIAQHTPSEYRKILYAAFSNGISPLQIKEVLYHAVPYIGMPKVAELIEVANVFLKEKGVKLPLEPQAVVNSQTRLEKGLEIQKSIFGNQIDKLYKLAPADQLHFQRYLSANCFGDYQTRPVFDVKMRELLTFSILISMGGTDAQVKSHVQGNVNVGNDKQTLLAVTTQLLPYIGYPRTLNAVTCINEIIPDKK